MLIVSSSSFVNRVFLAFFAAGASCSFLAFAAGNCFCPFLAFATGSFASAPFFPFLRASSSALLVYVQNNVLRLRRIPSATCVLVNDLPKCLPPVVTNGDQWRQMETQLDQRRQMETIGVQWKSMETNGDQRRPIKNQLDQQRLMETNEDQARPMEKNGDQGRPS